MAILTTIFYIWMTIPGLVLIWYVCNAISSAIINQGKINPVNITDACYITDEGLVINIGQLSEEDADTVKKIYEKNKKETK